MRAGHATSTCAVVVSYNRKPLLEKALDALDAQTAALDEIIVVDNGSTDGAREYLASAESATPIHTVLTESNGGGAGGFSLGVETAIARGHQRAWLMDDDAEPHADAHRHLRDAWDQLDNSGFAASFLASRVETFDGRLLETHCPPPTETDAPFPEIGSGSFVGAYVDLRIAASTALPIREFFLYHDDLEYTSRLTRTAPGYWIERSVVRHPEKATDGDFGSAVRFDARNLLWIRRNQWMSNDRVRQERTRRLLLRALFQGKVAKDRRLFLRSIAAGWRDALTTTPEERFAQRPRGQ